MGKIRPDLYIRNLMESIDNVDHQSTITVLEIMHRNIKDTPELVAWIVEPKNIQSVHSALNEKLGVPKKAMMLKSTPGSNRLKRADLFLRAMISGVKRTSNNE